MFLKKENPKAKHTIFMYPSKIHKKGIFCLFLQPSILNLREKKKFEFYIKKNLLILVLAKTSFWPILFTLNFILVHNILLFHLIWFLMSLNIFFYFGS